jgi:DNA (cytosine-5)-methyltransferase 1
VRVLDCFAGIGGFSLGLERAGFETVAFCEIEPYCQKVLAKHWPEVPIYDDIRRVTADRLIRDGIRPDVITGGFPCQDLSAAGKQAGIDGERSGLWAELARLLREIRPRYAVFENVPNLLNGDGGNWFKRILWDIWQVGYDAEWHCVPASYIGAPHRRDRVWLLAYPSGVKRESRAEEQGILRDLFKDGTVNDNAGGSSQAQDKRCWAVEPELLRVANGIPARSHRLRCLGNAVVPQIPELIGRAIMEGVADG